MGQTLRMRNDSYVPLLVKAEAITVEPKSRRIKLYQLPSQNNMFETIEDCKVLGRNKGCDKLIFYVRKEERNKLSSLKVYQEGVIEGFFQGEDAFIYAMFLHPVRNHSIAWKQDQIVMEIVRKDHKESKETDLPDGYVMRSATKQDAYQMAKLYDTVFKTYPTRMNDPEYIQEMMDDHVYFTIVEYDGQVVSASSADRLPTFNAAEMTDCATLADHRNQGLLYVQFAHLTNHMKQKGLQTLFCYARSISVGMNLINARNGFTYGGRMVQNSNIDGRLECMNIWFKNL